MPVAPGITRSHDATKLDGEPTLAVQHVSKSFGSTKALKSVRLEMWPGEVLGLVGHNGSGKSTLVGVLAGQHIPDPGAMATLRGRRVPFPLVRAGVGLGVVSQDLGLADDLTALENFTIGRRIHAKGRDRLYIDWRREHREVAQILEDYGVSIDLDRNVGQLPLLQRALLAIVRCAEDLKNFGCTSEQPGIIVLDEPTVFLPAHEQHFLFDLVRDNARRGTSVVVVSHDLHVTRELADRVVVLREGEIVHESDMASVSDERLVELIAGQEITRRAPTTGGPARLAQPTEVQPETTPQQLPQPASTIATLPRAVTTTADVVYEVRGLQGGRVADLDLEVRRGEILGVAGLVGSGAEDLPYLLFGSMPRTGGHVVVNGEQREVGRPCPRASIELGVGLVPADRAADGLVEAMEIWENLLLLVNSRYYRHGFMHHAEALKAAADLCREFDVLPPDPRASISSLSGGNQQKILLAKWHEIKPAVLLLHEPTHGVDVGARRTIHQIVRRMAAGGTAILWFTNDFEEMAMLTDRVVIMSHGRIMQELRGPEATAGNIALAVLGTTESTEDGPHDQ